MPFDPVVKGNQCIKVAVSITLGLQKSKTFFSSVYLSLNFKLLLCRLCFCVLTLLSATVPEREENNRVGQVTSHHCSLFNQGLYGSPSMYYAASRIRFLLLIREAVARCQSNRPLSSYLRMVNTDTFAGHLLHCRRCVISDL